MSTRAIVEVRDTEECWRLYVHNDGYPEGLGQRLAEFIEFAPTVDFNHPQFDRNQAPFVSPNAAHEAAKFAIELACYLNKGEYHGIYLTKRDAIKECEKDWTDIGYLYRVYMPHVRGGPIVAEYLKLPFAGPVLAMAQPLPEPAKEVTAR